MQQQKDKNNAFLTPEELICKYKQIIKAPHENIALLDVKLKRFAKLNRILGLEIGDEALVQLHRVIAQWLKPDECCARMYANCFQLICSFKNIQDIHSRIRFLCGLIKNINLDNPQARVFVGIGVYRIPANAPDFNIAQYNAYICRKESTQAHYRNSHYEIYGYSYKDINEVFFSLDDKVLPAIENHEFKLFLQPKVNLKTGRVDGAEALLRWFDAKGTMIPLSSFMPGLEQTGAIRNVDLYTFDKVCACLDKWTKLLDYPFNISVNLSRAYFEDEDFFADYTKVYEKYDFPPKNIEIEFLESIIFDRLSDVRRLVDKLRNYGFNCALDDFGSGFSAFNVLSNANLNTLKLDRSLFMDSTNLKERAVVKNIVHTAADLSLETVAEGVESTDYVKFLQECGCDFVQGYVFYKPMPVEEFEQRFIINKEQISF